MFGVRFVVVKAAMGFLQQRYQANPNLRPRFLCVVWNIRRELRAPQYKIFVDNVKKVLNYFKLSEIPGCVYTFVRFLLDEVLQPKPLSTYEGKSAYRERASQQKINEMGAQLSSFVWNDHIVSLDSILLALMDACDDPNALALVQYLLVEDRALVDRVEYYCSLGIGHSHMLETDFHAKHMRYYERYGTPIPQLPTYYGNECLAMLPVIDLLLGRLIELNKPDVAAAFKADQFSQIIQKYNRIYLYHHRAAQFVLDTLQYYDTAEALSSSVAGGGTLKEMLLSLCSHAIEMGDAFKSWRTSRNDELVSSDEYFSALVQRCGQAVNCDPKLPLLDCTSPFYQDYGSYTELVLYSTAIELLVSPVSQSTIVSKLLNPILNELSSPFHVLEGVGMLMSLLPAHFRICAFERLVKELSNCTWLASDIKDLESGMLSGDRCPSVEMLCGDYASYFEAGAVSLPTTVIALFHCIFSHCSIEAFDIFPQLIKASNPTSVKHCYVLCRVFAPWMYRVGSSLLGEVLRAFFLALQRVGPSCAQLIYVEACEWSIESATHNTGAVQLLDDVTDFLHHAYNIVNLPDKIVAEISGIISTLSPVLRERFEHINLSS